MCERWCKSRKNVSNVLPMMKKEHRDKKSVVFVAVVGTTSSSWEMMVVHKEITRFSLPSNLYNWSFWVPNRLTASEKYSWCLVKKTMRVSFFLRRSSCHDEMRKSKEDAGKICCLQDSSSRTVKKQVALSLVAVFLSLSHHDELSLKTLFYYLSLVM